MSCPRKGLESCMSSQGRRGQETDAGQGQRSHCPSREGAGSSHTLGRARRAFSRPSHVTAAELSVQSQLFYFPNLTGWNYQLRTWMKSFGESTETGPYCAHWAEGPGSCLFSVSPVLRAPLVYGVARTEQTRLACGRHSANTVLSTSDSRLPCLQVRVREGADGTAGRPLQSDCHSLTQTRCLVTNSWVCQLSVMC